MSSENAATAFTDNAPPAEPEDAPTTDQNDGSDAPADAAGWRALITSIPPRDLLRLVKESRPRQAAVFAGFRPTADALKNPVVLGRLVDEAMRHPAFGTALRERVPPPTAPSESDAANSLPSPPPPARPARPAAPAAESGTGSRLRDQLEKNRSLLKEKDQRIAELEALLADATRERDAARAEAEAANRARKAAETLADRERRQRERDARKAAAELERRKAAPEPQAPAAQVQSVPVAPTPAPPAAAAPFEEALRRLLSRGKFAAVAEVCREAIVRGGVKDAPAAARATVYALYAEALYGQAEDNSDLDRGAEQDLRAIVAFLDAGDVLRASRSLVRFLSEGTLTRSQVVGDDITLLKRLVALAERTRQSEAVCTELLRLRLIAPQGFALLMRALDKGGQKLAAFRNSLALQGRARAVGADEVIGLPNAGSDLPSVTPRRLVEAVEAGDARFVLRVRDALSDLRRSPSAGIAEGMLSAVAEISRVAVYPYTSGTGSVNSDRPRAAIVDASNVARHDPDPLALTPPPRVANLMRMRDYLLRRGFFPVLLVADASLRYHVDDRMTYESLIDRGVVVETPSGREADETLIAEARERDAILVSNDRLSEWGDAVRRIERFGFTLSTGGVSLIPV